MRLNCRTGTIVDTRRLRSVPPARLNKNRSDKPVGLSVTRTEDECQPTEAQDTFNEELLQQGLTADAMVDSPTIVVVQEEELPVEAKIEPISLSEDPLPSKKPRRRSKKQKV